MKIGLFCFFFVIIPQKIGKSSIFEVLRPPPPFFHQKQVFWWKSTGKTEFQQDLLSFAIFHFTNTRKLEKSLIFGLLSPPIDQKFGKYTICYYVDKSRYQVFCLTPKNKEVRAFRNLLFFKGKSWFGKDWGL